MKLSEKVDDYVNFVIDNSIEYGLFIGMIVFMMGVILSPIVLIIFIFKRD